MQYKILNKKEKALIARSFKTRTNTLLTNLKTNLNIIAINKTVKTYADAAKELNKIDIAQVFKIDNQKTFFKCEIFEDAKASISQNKDDKYRYFSQNLDGTFKVVLGIVDIYEIITNQNFYKSITDLCTIFKIEVREGKWIMQQKIKIADNIALIRDAEESLIYRYPALYKYLQKHLYLLIEMQTLALKNLQTEKESVKGDSVFFTSARHIEEWLTSQENPKSAQTINRLLNTFCALGLIKKAHIEQIPQHLKQQALQIKKDKNFMITFYQVPNLDWDILTEAEKRAIKLQKAKISATSTNSGNIKKVLGQRVWEAVYKDTAEVTEIIKEIKYRKNTDIIKEFKNENDDKILDELFG